MPLLTQAALAMWWGIDAPDRREFEHWHSAEHLPERLGIPGFHRGTRWSAAGGGGTYFVMYEIDSLALLDSQTYLERVNDPTPWSAKVMRGFRNMVRSRCRISSSQGAGVGGVLATVRLAPQPGKELALRQWLQRDLLPGVPAMAGLASAHLLENVAPPGQSLTTEQKLRGGDAMADWAVLVGGYSAAEVSAFTDARLAEGPLVARGALEGSIRIDLFTLQHSMARSDLAAEAP